MFKFFTKKKWQLWSWLGSFVILLSLWVQVKIDVKINEWFGVFYDMIQKALAKPNAITIEEYWANLASFKLLYITKMLLITAFLGVSFYLIMGMVSFLTYRESKNVKQSKTLGKN